MTTKDRREYLEEVNFIFEFTLFPFWRIVKLLASKNLKDKFRKNRGGLIFDMVICIFWFSVLYMLGRCDLFGYHFTIFWQLGGVIVGILIIALLIGYFRRKLFRNNEPTIENEKPQEIKKPINRAEYRTISNGLESLGYKPSEVKKAADYVFQKYNDLGTDLKMIEAIKYFGNANKI